MARLSIVLPVYDERSVLEALYRQIVAAVERTGLERELVIVDDGSRDGSGELLDAISAADPTVRVLHLARNFGHQAAVQCGLDHASGDAVVVMDSDLQDCPDAIPDLVDAWQAGHEVVYAVRTDRKEGGVMRALFAGFYRALRLVADVRIPLDAGNFGLLDRRVVDVICSLPERDRFHPGLRSWVGFRQIGVPVERGARYDGRSRVGIAGLFRLAQAAFFSFSSAPLAVFYVAATLSGIVFVGLGIFTLYHRLITGHAIPGWTSILLTSSFFGGLNALGICVLGEIITRIYDQVRERPLYVVARSSAPGAPGATPESPAATTTQRS